MPATTPSASLHVSPLAAAPAGFTIPAKFRDRFWYEDDRRRLVFDGFMSRADYEALAVLSRDPDYRRALDELFRLAVPLAAASPAISLGPWLAYVAALLVVGALALLLIR